MLRLHLKCLKVQVSYVLELVKNAYNHVENLNSLMTLCSLPASLITKLLNKGIKTFFQMGKLMYSLKKAMITKDKW